MDFNYNRLNSLYKTNSYFLSSYPIGENTSRDLIIPNESNSGEYIKLKFYKIFQEDFSIYYFYKIEKNN